MMWQCGGAIVLFLCWWVVCTLMFTVGGDDWREGLKIAVRTILFVAAVGLGIWMLGGGG